MEDPPPPAVAPAEPEGRDARAIVVIGAPPVDDQRSGSSEATLFKVDFAREPFSRRAAFGRTVRMPTFPDEVLTTTKKGETEVRSLIDRGRYVRYNYLHPATGEPMEGGKVKLVLLSDSGTTQEFFIIPTKSRRDLLLPAAEKGARKVWDGTKAVEL